MSLCTSELTAIRGTDCIGDSRLVINGNFAVLSADVCTAGTAIESLSTGVVVLSSIVAGLSAKDSETVDLNFTVLNSSSVLSAEIINSSLGTVKLGKDIPTTTKIFLTATKISTISDVDINNLNNDQVLAWNTSLGKWVNRDEIGTTSQVAEGIYGDVTVTNNGNTWTINNIAVTGPKIASGAVSTTKLDSQAVTTEKLASTGGSEAVTTATIRDSAVTTIKINNSAVTSEKLADGAVTTEKILDEAVTNTKLASAVPLSIKGNPNSFINSPEDIVADVSGGVLRRFNDTIGFGAIDNSATTATSANTPNTIVARNEVGDFLCNTITATGSTGLIGTALSATLATQAVQLQTARTIQLTGQVVGSAVFDGTNNITITTTGSGENNTGVNTGTGVGVFRDKTNNILNFKSLSAGPEITITSDTDHIVISNNITATPLQAQAKAWVYFNAQTGTINSSYNVTSIQRLGEGVWFINLTPGLFVNTNYCVVASTMQGNTGDPQYTFGGETGNNSGLYADVACVRPNNTSQILYETFKSYDVRSDNVFNSVVIFG